MGVYATIHVCLGYGSEPLDPSTRVAIVEQCVAAEFAHGTCTLTISRDPKLGFVERARHALFGWWPFATLGERGLQPYAGPPGRHAREFERRWEGDASGLVEAVAALSNTPFLCNSLSPRWKGERMDAGFVYAALAEPVDVRVPSSHAMADPHVGRFCDVLTLTTRTALDGRSLANSALVRWLKKELDLRVTCRAHQA